MTRLGMPQKGLALRGSLLFAVVSSILISSTSASEAKWACKRGNITLERALILDQGQTTAGINRLAKGAAVDFSGLSSIPADIQIVGGPSRYTVQFPTDLRLLPSVKSTERGGLLPPYTGSADCIVRTVDGSLWLVSHDVGRKLFYIYKSDTSVLNQGEPE